MIKKLIFVLTFLLSSQVIFAQFQDNFSDGDFAINPTWIGHDSIFTITSGELQSQRNGALNYYLTTPSTLSVSAQWEFYINLQFSTSGANWVDVYLMSDVDDLTAVNDGYFVRLGNTADGIYLYEVVGGNETMLIDTVGVVNSSSNNPFNIKVTRDAADNWTLFFDDGAMGTYTSAGAITSSAVNSSTFFGVMIKQSSAASPVNGHFFDNFVVGAIGVDVTPPTVDSIVVQNANDIDVYFSEDIDVTTGSLSTNFFIDNAQENPSSVIIEVSDSSLAHLTFPTAFLNGQSDTLFINNVEDRSANVILSDDIPFFYLLTLAANYRDVVFNEILPDPNPQVYLPNAEFVEIYNTSSNVYDLSGWQFINSTTVKTFPAFLLQADSTVILCSVTDTSVYQSYGDVIGFSPWTALSNGGDSLTLLDNSGTVIDIVSYDDAWYNDPVKDDGGWSLELINPLTPCGTTASNWTASNDTIGGTPGEENSTFSTTPDITSPDLVSLTIVNDSVIQLFFNETMDSASLAAGVYGFTGGVSLDFVQSISSDLISVSLVLAASIDTGTFYTVTVNSVTDCPGNSISVINTLQFVIGSDPVAGGVVINEIMCDPTPSVALPEKEFVELYNTTTQLVDLSGTFFDGEELPVNSFIQPNGYLTICSVNDTDEYSGFGDVVGLQSFPTLTNGGELIDLVDAQGNIIDQIEYSDTWYLDAAKDGGGWSLEKKNPTAICNGASNWAAANNFIGGTPSNQNSIYESTPEQNLPTVIDILVPSSTTAKLVFSESMDSTSLVNGNYSVSGGVSVISATTLGSPFDSIFLLFSPALDTGTTYSISVTNVTDCPGNSIGSPNSIDFILAPMPSLGDVVINEIFADPSPIIGLPDQEFVELYNTTGQVINLSGSSYAGKTIPNRSYIPANGFVILCEDEDSLLFSQYGMVIGLSSWPELTNGGKYLALTNAGGVIIDQVTYNSSWYADSEKDDGGYSLEKVNPFAVCNFDNNWRASNDDSGGTPGRQNSVYSLATDTISPNLIKVLANSITEIEAVFNEGMNLSSLFSATYTINNSIIIDSVQLDSNNYYGLKLFISPISAGVIYTLTIDGVMDCPGNSIDKNIADFVLPENGEPGDLIINEVLFNPSLSASDDFVEVYNNSSKYIDISEWSLASYDFDLDSIDNVKLVGGQQHILYPQTYALVTEDTAATFEIYPLSAQTTFIETDLPTYSNDEGVVILISKANEVSDRFDYDADMHFPLLTDDKGVSLERLDFDRETNDYTNWHSAAENIGFATPGYENSQYQPADKPNNTLGVDPEIFSPDQDGYNDLLNISYELPEPGYVGTILIYDSKGRLARRLMNNELLGPDGTISWDGTNDLNEKSRIGIYIIFFSAYSTGGDVIKEKVTCVLASQL